MKEDKARENALKEFNESGALATSECPDYLRNAYFKAGHKSRDKELAELVEIIKSSIVFLENNTDCDRECMDLHDFDETCRHDDYIFKARGAIK